MSAHRCCLRRAGAIAGSLAGLVTCAHDATSGPSDPAEPRPKQWDVPANLTLATHVPAWAAACEAPPCTYSRMVDGAVETTGAWVSQFGEDVWLWDHLFFNKRDGFFLEFGAMDGMQWSNTRWLSEHAGWKGLLIEACPEQYARLAQQRSNDITVHAAICDSFQQVHWISQAAVGGIYEFMAPEFKAMFHKDVDSRVDQLPIVPCVPIMWLLEKHGISHIDFWSLDVEGAELAVLQSFDFTKVRVNALVVETDGNNKTKDAMVTELLEHAGFLAVEHGPDKTPWTLNTMDTVFVWKEFLPHRSARPGVTTLQTR